MAQSKKNGKTNRTGRTAKQKRMPRYEADSLAACLMVGILLLARDSACSMRCSGICGNFRPPCSGR